MKFSVIVVSLDPGEKLNQTLDSVLRQTYGDYEIVVKDGGSSDGSVEKMRRDGRIRLFSEKDGGIYDAMNQAVGYAQGEYYLFLNCGDVLYDATVLERTAEQIERMAAGVQVSVQGGKVGVWSGEAGARPEDGVAAGNGPAIFYGDTYGSKNDVLIVSPPVIDGFACYRNIPCHQSCFYAAELCRRKPYDPKYRIRADYEHFLWCYYEAKANMVHMDLTVAAYEGGGYSESKENRRRDKEEHREITERYMGAGELWKYRLIMLLTLAPLRSFLAENKMFSGVYHRLKNFLYR